MRKLLLLSIAAITVCAATIAQADVPTSMNIQGRLTDTSGASIGERFMEFGFQIFDAPTGGALIWPGELQEIYVDLSGLWNARVGALNPLTEAVFSDTSRWLEVTVGDSANLPDTLPRIKLNTTPFTYRSASSQRADTATYALSSGGGWTDDGTTVRLESPNDSVGIGTASPTVKLDVIGSLRVTEKAAIGPGNSNAGSYAFVAGINNTASNVYTAVSGGRNNAAQGSASNVGGGTGQRRRRTGKHRWRRIGKRNV